MFDFLTKKINNTVKKVTKAITEKELDKESFDKIFWELELSLLENNVSTEVVDRIKLFLEEELVGQKINKNFKKVIKNNLKKIIKEVLVEEKISNFLKKIDNINPFIIMFIGVNGSGKCIDGDSFIILGDGSHIKIKNFFNKLSKNHQVLTDENDYYINVKNEEFEALSIDTKTLKQKKMKIHKVWKLKKPKELYEVKLRNGNAVKTTYDHPFFVLDEGRIKMIKAGELQNEDFVMIPRLIKSEANYDSLIKLWLSRIDNKKFYIKADKVFNLIENNSRNLTKDICNETNLYFWRKNKIMPLWLASKYLSKFGSKLSEQFTEEFLIKYKKSNFLKIGADDSRFWEFMGFFYAEGSLDKRSVHIFNSNKNLINSFKEYFENKHNIYTSLIKDKRNGVYRLSINSATLRNLIKELFNIPPKQKVAELYIPEWFSYINKNNQHSFLRGYFEGNGHINKNSRSIEVTSKSKSMIDTLTLALLRFNIISSNSVKMINNIPYYKLSIFGDLKLKKFQEKINFLSEEKISDLNNSLEVDKRFEITELIPHQGKLIRELRISNQLKQSDISQIINSSRSLISYIENNKSELSRTQLQKILSNTKNYDPFLKKLANSDVSWSQVKKVKKIINKDKHVYDLTIPKSHNFVANGVIVHNTTTLAKLAHFLKKKKYSCVMGACDTFRAASIEQLKVHGKKLDVPVVSNEYGSDAASVGYDTVKYAQSKKKDVVLLDTAGRLQTNKNLMNELEKIKKVTQPDCTIFVADSLTGNDATNQAETFQREIEIDYNILTKTDVDQKGGAVLSVGYATKKPILFLGTGQEYEDLKHFKKEEIIKKLLL